MKPPRFQGERKVIQQTGGSVKTEGLGDGLTHGTVTIAKLRFTLPPTKLDNFTFALAAQSGILDIDKFNGML